MIGEAGGSRGLLCHHFAGGRSGALGGDDESRRLSPTKRRGRCQCGMRGIQGQDGSHVYGRPHRTVWRCSGDSVVPLHRHLWPQVIATLLRSPRRLLCPAEEGGHVLASSLVELEPIHVRYPFLDPASFFGGQWKWSCKFAVLCKAQRRKKATVPILL